MSYEYEEVRTDVTLVIEVWHQDEEGRNTYADQFSSLGCACRYAIAHKGKIAYGMPMVTLTKTIYYYDTNAVLTAEHRRLEEKEIYACAKAIERSWGI